MSRNELLLDTHVFLWWRADDGRLRAAAREAIATADLVFVSAASAWEAAIKASLGKLALPGTFEAEIDDSGFDKLAITVSHAESAAGLPRTTAIRSIGCSSRRPGSKG